MINFSQLLRHARSQAGRTGLLALAPSLLFVLLLWAKLSYFNFPPAEQLGTDWVGWRLKEAVQAWASTFAAVVLLCSPILLLRPVPRYVALALLDLLVTAIVLADLVHFRFYGDVLSVTAVAAAGQVGGVAESVRQLVRPTDVLLVVDLVVAALALPLYVRACRRVPEVETIRFRPYLPRAVALALLLLLAAPVRIVALDEGDTFRDNYFRLFGVRKIGLLNYHAYEAGRQYLSAVLAGVQISEEDRTRALGTVDAWRDEATRPSALYGAAAGKNVLFVLLESFHAFPIGLRVEGQEITPNLNALAGRSLYFENFYDQTWDGTTSDGEFTALQSLHPLPAGAVATTFPYHNYRGVPAILRERGYSTMSAHGYWGTLWNMQLMHPRLGFERSYFRDSYRPTEEIGMGLSDAEFFRQTAPRLRELPRPFMAYLMTLTSHHPFDLPAKYRELELGELEGTMVGGYLHSAHYTDAALGELVETLKRDGLWEETVLVLFGDHKASLDDPAAMETLLTRYAGFPARRPGFDPRYWREENRLAFLVHLPGDVGAGVRRESVGQVDIAPTVLNLLGIGDHTMVTLGRDATRGEDQLVVLRDGSFVLADTVCVQPDATRAAPRCGLLDSGRDLDPSRFQRWRDEARGRLELSDLVIRGDLIPTE